MSRACDTFFTRIFGFEEKDYLKSRAELYKRATFSAPPATSAAQRIASLPARAERCHMTIDGFGVVDAGTFYEPSVAEMRSALARKCQEPEAKSKIDAAAAEFKAAHKGNTVVIANTVGESQEMHSMAKYANCVFQAASQFNYLEFPSCDTTPEEGIAQYEYDSTQGPACAIACAVGTAVRNYLLAPLTNLLPEPNAAIPPALRGQHAACQRNGLAELEAAFLKILKANGSDVPAPWTVKGGYIEAAEESLADANALLRNEVVRDALRPLLRVGVHENTSVIDGDKVVQSVTQVYCSAVSVGYSATPANVWKPLASLVLDGLYESTFAVGAYHAAAAIEAGQPPPKLLLTKVGGGVFGNESLWIKNAIQRAALKTSAFGVPLEVELVHYGEVETDYEDSVVAKWSV